MKIDKLSTKPPKGLSKDKTKKKMENMHVALGELQNLMMAECKHSILVVIQGMDASGKDGLIRNAFREVNPMGVRVQAFKKPSELEMKHDFLWRIHQHVPEKGIIQIFNRSHYEDILIQRVHKWVDMDVIKRRMHEINDFERLLQNNGTHVMKFFLNISHKEQQERLKERMLDPSKKWKYNEQDFAESQLWPDYMKAYEDAINKCNEIPWHVVPSDANWYKEYFVLNTMIEKLKSLNMQFPGEKKGG